MNIRNIPLFAIVLILSSLLTIINGLVVILNNAPIVFSTYPVNTLEEIWTSKNFWGRIFFGIPQALQSGWAYTLFLFAFLEFIIAVYVSLRPKRVKNLSLWIITFSLLSIPIGGGFYLGALISIVIGLYASEFPKPFNETFIGNIINTLRLSSQTLGIIIEKANIQRAVATLTFIAILSGFGSTLYSYNVFCIYPYTDDTNKYVESAATNILLKGMLYTASSVFLMPIAYIIINIIKWLILSVTVYILAFRLIGENTEFTKLSGSLAYVYVPETILLFMPIIFTNEPNLSKTWVFFLIPMSWPLLLFYISRTWDFVILTFALAKLQNISTSRALGRALFAVIPYLLISYILVHPSLQAPGFTIGFTGTSSVMLLLVCSIAIIIAMFLGAFGKER